MNRRAALNTCAAALIATASASMAAAPVAAEPISVGVIANLTGTDVRTSVNMTRGIEMAVADINEAGGIDGNPITLITEDSEYRLQEAMNAANKLYGVDNVEVAIMFGGSSLMIPVANLAQDKGRVLINTSSSSSKLGDYPGTLFSVLPLDDIIGKKLGEWVAERGHKSAAFVVPNNTFGTGLMNAAADAFVASGGEVLAQVAYTEGNPNYRADMQTVANVEPDAIIAAGYGDDSRTIFKNAQQLDIAAPWYGAYPTIFAIDDEEWMSERFFGVDNGGASLKSTMELAERYRAEYGEEPLSHVFYGYDAMQIVAKAMELGGTSSSEIAASLPEVVKSYEGATGKITWDDRGQRIDPPVEFVEFKDGAFHILGTGE